MLVGQGGEVFFGVFCVVVGVGMVWALVRAASAGIATREADRQRQQRNQ